MSEVVRGWGRGGAGWDGAKLEFTLLPDTHLPRLRVTACGVFADSSRKSQTKTKKVKKETHL